MAAIKTKGFMTPESGCAASFDRPHDPSLLGSQKVILPILLPMSQKDICYLDKRSTRNLWLFFWGAVVP